MSLWAHLGSAHFAEYLEQAEKENWNVLVYPAQDAIEKGYTISEVRAHFAAGEDIWALPDLKKTSGGAAPDTSGHAAIPPYTTEQFYKYLAAFITIDDQVSTKHAVMSYQC